MIYTYIEQLINYGIKNSLIEEEDKIVVKNEIMNLLNLKDWIGPKEINFAIPEYPQDILNKICDWAVSEKIIENGIGDRDLFDTLLMGKMTPYPREVIAKFRNLAAEKIENATEDYYKFSKKTNYIRTDRIAKNLYWLSPTE